MPFAIAITTKGFSKNPRERNTCVVEALSIACDIGYDIAHKDLEEGANRLVNGRCNIEDLIYYLDWIGADSYRGWKFEWFPLQAVKGEPRIDPEKFCEMFPKGRFLMRVSRHVVDVIDGTYYDHTNWGHRCVYGAWRVTRTEEIKVA